MIVKVCQFKARSEQGERLVEVFHPGDMEKAAAFFSKRASPMLPEVQTYLEKLQPSASKIYVLVNALGAGEFWSSNINGDFFGEAALIHRGPVYGYETFYQAFAYKHHANKQPDRSFGRIELSVWNDLMKRVELVVVIDRERASQFGAQDVCDKLDHGQFLDVSMGCKVPYDMCSICLDWAKYREAQSTYLPGIHASVGQAVLVFHRKNPIRGVSVTRDDYCEHLKGSLNRILGDGRKVYAINDYPRFFDISFVFIGADKTAKVMAKLALAYTGGSPYVAVPSWQVAEEMGYEQPSTEKEFVMEKAAAKVPAVAEEIFKKALRPVGIKLTRTEGVEAVRAKLREKKASQAKGAEIIKEVVPSQFGSKAIPVDGSRPDLPTDVLDQIGSHPLSEALSTPTTMGMILKPHEFQRITIIHMGKKPMADKLDEEGKVFAPTDETDNSTPLGSEHFSEILKKLLIPLLEDRSFLDPIANRRMVRITITKAQPEEEAAREPVKEDPFLQKISAAYNGYLDRFVDCWKGSEEIVNSNPDLWEAVFRQGVGDGFAKEAAGVNLQVIAGGALAGYGLSEYARWQREKARMGQREPVGITMDLMAEWPKTLTALGALAALQQQGSDIPTRLYHGLKGVLTMGK